MNNKKLLATAAISMMAFAGCADLSSTEESGGKSSVDGSSKSGDSAQLSGSVTKEDQNAGENVIGNWKILNKPHFGKEFGMFKSVKLKVKNVSGSEDEPFLEIRLTKGNNLVTTFDCVGNTVRPGERTTLECTTLDDYNPNYTDYEIKNTF